MNTPGFMSEAELAEGTGYTQAAAQIRYLQREGIAHRIDRFGRPHVTWAQWEGKQGTKADDGYRSPSQAA